MINEDQILAYKEILSAYRNGDKERYPDAFEEAFTAVETCPELAEWFESDQQLDDSFRNALAEFETPPLKSIPEEPAKIVRFPFLKIAAAAILILGLCGIGITANERSQDQKSAALVEELRQDLTTFANSAFELDAMGNDLNVLRELIISKGGSKGPVLEQVFANGLPMGCKLVDLGDHTVSLYCFGNDKGQVVHAFVMPASDLNGGRAEKYMQEVKRYVERDTGGWIEGETAYMLVSSMPGVDIKPFLLPAQEVYASVQRTHFAPKVIATTLLEID